VTTGCSKDAAISKFACKVGDWVCIARWRMLVAAAMVVVVSLRVFVSPLFVLVASAVPFALIASSCSSAFVAVALRSAACSLTLVGVSVVSCSLTLVAAACSLGWIGLVARLLATRKFEVLALTFLAYNLFLMLDPVYFGVECLELEAVFRVMPAVRSTKVTHANITFRFVGRVESNC